MYIACTSICVETCAHFTGYNCIALLGRLFFFYYLYRSLSFKVYVSIHLTCELQLCILWKSSILMCFYCNNKITVSSVYLWLVSVNAVWLIFQVAILFCCDTTFFSLFRILLCTRVLLDRGNTQDFIFLYLIVVLYFIWP